MADLVTSGGDTADTMVPGHTEWEYHSLSPLAVRSINKCNKKAESVTNTEFDPTNEILLQKV